MTFSRKLATFYQNPQALVVMGRGIEREGLRIDSLGNLSNRLHPSSLGSALTNKWITTDFAEQLLEFITPVSLKGNDTLNQLRDIHSFTYHSLKSEMIWPLSMPCFIEHEEEIILAQYGSSNRGKFKTLYRQGLKNRYGSMMQVIAGVHFNFSFSENFWQQLFGEQITSEREAAVSEAYFGLIRNYYRFGWVIPYLFGASPAICSSFLKKSTNLKFSKISESTFYLPYATSLRLSDLGYTNSAQSGLKIGFNSIEEYVQSVKNAIRTPSEDFAQIGVKNGDEYQQINANVLQIEAELYAPIRPKRVTQKNETPSQALNRAGVQYVEVRSLDVNPFSPTGFDQQQMDFLDVFLTWCVLSESAPMQKGDLECWRDNWNKIILEGRKPDLMLKIDCDGARLTQADFGKRIFSELCEIAELMDSALETPHYLATCQELVSWFDMPERTYSAKLLKQVVENKSISKTGLVLAEQHQTFFAKPDYQYFSEQDFKEEAKASFARQQQIESKDVSSFEDYLENYLKNALV